jgi:hypothetical protein
MPASLLSPADLSMGARLIGGLPRLLRHPIRIEGARATLEQRLERREADFLDLIRWGVYENPVSPYRELLRLAGCELGDLERLVARQGLEEALGRLYAHGVYLTVDELKGRRPAIRGRTSIDVDPARLFSPRLAPHLMAQSSGIFEATKFTGPCEVSRGTIANYLAALEATFVVHMLRPYSSHRPTEIVSAPKVYGFDTGFICYHRGWHRLRHDDLGLLWEHFVLNEIQAHRQTRAIRYWRDKRGHEVDFILARGKQAATAIECKWSAADFDSGNLQVFRRAYPQGGNLVVANDVDRTFTRSYGGVSVRFVSLSQLITRLEEERLSE